MIIRLYLFLSLGLLTASPVLGQETELSEIKDFLDQILPYAETVYSNTGPNILFPLDQIGNKISSAQVSLSNLPWSLSIIDLLNFAAIRSQLNKTIDSHNLMIKKLRDVLEMKQYRFNEEASANVAIANQIFERSVHNLISMIDGITLPLPNRLFSWSTGLLPGILSFRPVLNEFRRSLLLSMESEAIWLCGPYLFTDPRLDQNIKTEIKTAFDKFTIEIRKIIDKKTCTETLCQTTLIPIARRIRESFRCNPNLPPGPPKKNDGW